MTGRPVPSPFSKTVQREEKRQAILSEAAHLFNRQGSRATTLHDVAEQLQLTKTSLYYYVRSKEELIYQCYQASCDRFDEILEIAEREPSGADGLCAFARGYFDILQSAMTGRGPHYAILTEIQTLKDHQRKDIARRYADLFKRVRGLVETGRADGSIGDCETTAAALAVFGAVQFTVLWLHELPLDDFPQAADTFCDILLHGLAARDQAGAVRLPDVDTTPTGFDREARNQAKQEAFYRVGSDFFNRKGFKGTSLDEIAESLEVTKGAFYYHIKDKEELLDQCFRRSVGLMGEMLDRAQAEGQDGLDTLERAAHFLFFAQNHEAGPLIRFNLLTSLSPSHRRRAIREIRQLSERFGEIISAGIADGSIRAVDPVVAEQMINAAINTAIEMPMVRSVDDLAEASASYYQVFFSGLAAR